MGLDEYLLGPTFRAPYGANNLQFVIITPQDVTWSYDGDDGDGG